MNHKVVIVDDNESLCNLWKTWLTEAGYDVFTAYDGNGLFPLVAQEKPNLIILDILLPGADGIELAGTVRLDHPPEDLPIILVSGVYQRKDVRIHSKGAVNGFLAKPFGKETLISNVEELLPIVGIPAPPMDNPEVEDTMLTGFFGEPEPNMGVSYGSDLPNSPEPESPDLTDSFEIEYHDVTASGSDNPVQANQSPATPGTHSDQLSTPESAGVNSNEITDVSIEEDIIEGVSSNEITDVSVDSTAPDVPDELEFEYHEPSDPYDLTVVTMMEDGFPGTEPARNTSANPIHSPLPDPVVSELLAGSNDHCDLPQPFDLDYDDSQYDLTIVTGESQQTLTPEPLEFNYQPPPPQNTRIHKPANAVMIRGKRDPLEDTKSDSATFLSRKKSGKSVEQELDELFRIARK